MIHHPDPAFSTGFEIVSGRPGGEDIEFRERSSSVVDVPYTKGMHQQEKTYENHSIETGKACRMSSR